MYKLIKNEFGEISVIKDLDKKKYIPLDEANTDYQEYLAWTKASPKNVAAPADE